MMRYASICSGIEAASVGRRIALVERVHGHLREEAATADGGRYG